MRERPRRLLHDGLRIAADAHPDRCALVTEEGAYAYRDLCDTSLRLARALQECGVVRGDRVAIYMANGWRSAVAIYATLLAGGVMLVVNPQTKADKLAYILRDSGARVLLMDGELARGFAPSPADLPALSTVICAGVMPEGQRDAVAYDEVVAQSPPAPRDPGTIPLDLAALIYTSGSTGHPKGVMMTHQSMTFTAGSLIEYLRLDGDARILNVLPFAFDYGLYQLLMAVTLGATLVLEPAFSYPARVIERVARDQVTVFPGVPTVYATLVSLYRKAPFTLPTVTRVTNTAAALPPGFLPTLRRIFPNALIFAMYGLTECKRVSYLEPELLDEKPTSVGRAIPGTEVWLRAPDGAPVPPGEPGVLYVRGPHVMLGYWGQPELTARMLVPGQYPGERVLCTHDFFRLDADGHLYFVGRSDDIIKTRGEKVSPIEVENVLHGVPGVHEVAVVGAPDEHLGQAIVAFVALEAGASVTAQEIKRFCRARLEDYMVPRDVVFLSELPKTATGKVRKKSLVTPAD